MADTLRIRRRVTGSPGAPASLANAELAYNEVDHILYYGEGTGGTGGTASVVVGIAGQGLASSTNPVMDGTVAVGVASTWARADHVHPSDTSRAPTANPTFTGTVTMANLTATGTVTGAGFTALLGPYAPLASPTFTGVPAGPTAVPGTSTTQFATTAFVGAAITAGAVSPATVAPLMDGSAAVGVSLLYARQDHVHPTDTSRAPTASPTFTGTVTISGSITGVGMTNWAASPPAIGTTAAAAGAFTTLSASSTVSGAGFTAWAASPPAIGGTTPAAGAFTTLSATGAVSGAGFTAWAASPPPIGGTLAAAGTFTNLTATGTVSGAGFTTLLAPYALASSVPAASSTTPVMDGTAAIGVGTTYARADHVHPSDTSRAPLASPVFTGNPTGPTPATADSSTSLATTAFVKNQAYAPLASPVFTGTPTAPTAGNGTNNTQVATTAYVLATRIDQLQPPAVDVAWNSHKITGLLDPTNPQDAATKNYVDGAIQGLSATAPVQAASAGTNLTLSGTQTVDGVALVAGNRVLVKDQTTAANNGIYIVAAGAWTRSTDANTWAELPDLFTFVEMGTVNADSGWLCTVDPGGTLGTTAVTWVQFSQAGVITAGNGLTKSGTVISAVGTAGQIAVGAAIGIDPTYVGQTSITTLGNIATGTWNGTTIAVNRGGSGATTLTGYLVGNGAAAFTAVATIPNTAISGLGTMATQNATAVAITGGTIDGVTFDMGTF